MSLYDLNKDMLIKLITTIQDTETLSEAELIKLKNNCILSLKKLENSSYYEEGKETYSITLAREKTRLCRGLEMFDRLLTDSKVDDCNNNNLRKKLHIDFTIENNLTFQTTKLDTYINWCGHQYYTNGEDSCLTLGFGQEAYILTTNKNFLPDYLPHMENYSTLLVEDIIIFFKDNRVNMNLTIMK